MASAVHPILYFDGVCNLCNGAVQFVIKRDRKNVFRFASLQSNAGEKALEKVPAAAEKTGSLILQLNETYYVRSDAALHAARMLGGVWPLLYAAIVIPRPVRDWVYNIISKNRYRWFGKKEVCYFPTPELLARFIND